jgi:hypothetical protein
MAKKRHNPNPAGSKGNPVSLYPLPTDAAVRAILSIKPSDAKKIIAATPSNPKRRVKPK